MGVFRSRVYDIHRNLTRAESAAQKASLKIRIQKLDGWEKAGRDLQSLDLKIAAGYMAGAERFAELYLKEIDKVFRTNGHGLWPPLNDKYKNWKINKGYSDKIMRMTGTLQKAIGIIRTGKKIEVGLIHNNHPTSKRTLLQILTMHERGLKGQTPRPIFSLAWKKVGGRAKVMNLISFHIYAATKL